MGVTACSHFPFGDSVETEQPEAPLASGVLHDHFDETVQPQQDFYRWVNGTWLDETEIPSDRSNYGAFSVLADQAEQQLRDLIETAAATETKAGSDEQNQSPAATSTPMPASNESMILLHPPASSSLLFLTSHRRNFSTAVISPATFDPETAPSKPPPLSVLTRPA